MEKSNYLERDLKCIPWNHIFIADKMMLIKCLFYQDGYEMLLTDLKNVWHENLGSKSIQERAQEINEDIEVSLAKLLNILKEAVENRNSATNFSLQVEDEHKSEIGLILTATFHLAGLPFVWKFFGKPGTNEMLSEHLSEPLMMMVCQMAYQQRQLFQLLRDKDKELDDLKAQGVRPSRKHFETVPFDEDLFCRNSFISKDFETRIKSSHKNIFNDENRKLYSEIMMKSSLLENQPQLPGSNHDEIIQDGNIPSGHIPNPTVTSTTPKSGNTPTKSEATGQLSEELEMQRREQLEKRLADEEAKRTVKKKKTMKF